MIKKQYKSSESGVLMLAIGMPILSLIFVLIAAGLNQRAGLRYTNNFDSSFYHELIVVTVGYLISFILTLVALFLPLTKLSNKHLALALTWLVAVMAFWRYQAMGLKSLDCGGYGYSSSCTQLIPNKLDNVITAVVVAMLMLLAVAVYRWLRIYQSSSR